MESSSINKGKPLLQLPLGLKAKILRINDLLIAKRLFAMGLLPGSTITLVRQGPLSGTCYIKSGMITLALRREEAAVIDVV